MDFYRFVFVHSYLYWRIILKMKAETINKLVNKAVAEGKDPGNCVAELVKQEQDIKLRIRLRNNDKQVAKDGYNERMSELNKQIAGIQEQCPHLEHTFHGDPSGGNDGHTECSWCGKEL